jgi:hypothetical protein
MNDSLAADYTPSRTPRDLAASQTSYQSSSTSESDLHTSRVYRKLCPCNSAWYLNTSQQGSMALSAFSDLTMEMVSNISVFRLPILCTDLFNYSDYPHEYSQQISFNGPKSCTLHDPFWPAAPQRPASAGFNSPDVRLTKQG